MSSDILISVRRVTAFRIDRMKTPKIMEEDAVPKPEGFDVSAYSNKVFQMFSGEETTVELECDTSLMKYVIDRFGLDVETEELSEEKFLAKVPVDLSPTFYGWVFQFGGGDSGSLDRMRRCWDFSGCWIPLRQLTAKLQ